MEDIVDKEYVILSVWPGDMEVYYDMLEDEVEDEEIMFDCRTDWAEDFKVLRKAEADLKGMGISLIDWDFRNRGGILEISETTYSEALKIRDYFRENNLIGE